MRLDQLRRRFAHLDLVVVLLVAVLVQLALDRLAVPALQPRGVPPRWHRYLAFLGLYSFHLASMLAVGATLYKTWAFTRRRELFSLTGRVAVAVVAVPFVILAAVRVLLQSRHQFAFALESSFTGLLLVLALAISVRPADTRAKIGLGLLCVPFVIHYYGTFTLKMLVPSEQARWSSLPDDVLRIGTWSLALVALTSPLFFAPRPFRRSLLAPAPLGLALFVGLVAAVILRRDYDDARIIADRGFGVQLALGAPIQLIALYVSAVAAVAVTLAVTMFAPSHGRRRIGAGFALVVASGYAFVWPLQFLAAAAGAFAIVEGATDVLSEEQGSAPSRRFQIPPIPAATWKSYVMALREALSAGDPSMSTHGDRDTTTLLGRSRSGTLPYRLTLTREAEALATIEIVWGDPPGGEPAWTLAARAERFLAVGSHPAPPKTRAPVLARTGDAPFDRRFRVQGTESDTNRLLDEGMRAAAAAVLDGWLAVWPGRGLRYQVCPGRGAPLDHPVPVTELAFRAESEPHGTDKLVAVVNLLGEIAERAVAL